MAVPQAVQTSRLASVVLAVAHDVQPTSAGRAREIGHEFMLASAIGTPGDRLAGRA